MNKAVDTETKKLVKSFFEGEHVTDDVTRDWGWCPWHFVTDTTIEAAEGKAYEYEEWLKYIIDKVLAPKGYVLNGEVEWYGEEPDDRGKIVVTNNLVEIFDAEIIYKKKVL